MIKTAAVTVGTTATKLDVLSGSSSDDAQLIQVRVPPEGVRLHYGGPDVTTANGMFIDPGEAVELTLTRDDELFGIIGTGTQAVRILQAGI